MDRFTVVFNMLNKVGNIIVQYKNKDVTQDKECREILDELQCVCDMFKLQVGEVEGKLAREVCGAFLEYLCNAEEKRDGN